MFSLDRPVNTLDIQCAYWIKICSVCSLDKNMSSEHTGYSVCSLDKNMPNVLTGQKYAQRAHRDHQFTIYNGIPIDPNRPKLYGFVILTGCPVTSLDMNHHWMSLALHREHTRL